LTDAPATTRRDEPLPARRPYCLRCYATIDTRHLTCDHCSFPNPAALRQRYWTQEPALVRTESVLKATIAVLTAVACFTILRTMRHMGTGAGWFILSPAFLGIALWKTASGLTRRSGPFHVAVFWKATFALVAISGIVLGWWVAVVGVVMLGATIAWGRFFARWKVRRVQRPRPWPRRRPDDI